MIDYPSSPLDRRLNAYRDDLADARLQGQVVAKRFVTGQPARIAASSAAVRRHPSSDAPLDTEALAGEPILVFDDADGFAFVQLERDSYAGYVASAAIGPRDLTPTHRVNALRTFIYPSADMKRPPLEVLSLNAEVAVISVSGPFALLARNGAVHAAHLVPIGRNADDFVAVAERFVGTPYLWGGKTSIGCDCSGLVQLSLNASGIECPRDTGMQERALGRLIGNRPEPGNLQRGDLVFWPGHVGIMLDSERLLHANGHHMETVIEPLAEAEARIAATGTLIRSLKRLSPAQ